MASEDNAGLAVGAAGALALGPVGWAAFAAQLAGSLIGGHSARKQQRKIKAELERRRLALIDSKNQAIGRVAEGTAAAKAPLEAIAERVRTEESFRDPLLEQSLSAAAREQFGAAQRQTEAGQTSASLGIPQQQLMMAAIASQALLGSESRKLARRTESTRALAGLYGQMSEITQAGAQSAAGIETQYAQELNSQPMQDFTDVGAGQLGGFLSFLQTDSGKEALGGLFKSFQGAGEPQAAPQTTALGTGLNKTLNFVNNQGEGGLQDWLKKLMQQGFDFNTRYTR